MQATSRHQHLLMRTLPYDLYVKNIEGSNSELGDCLSRLGPLNDKVKFPNVQVQEINSRLQTTGSRIQILCEAPAQDNDVCICKHIVQDGWSNQIQEVLLVIQPQWNFHEEIIIEEGLFYKGQYHHPNKPKTKYPQATACRPCWFIKMLAQSKANNILSWKYNEIHELLTSC